MSKKVVNPYDKVTPEEVYDGLTSINYIEKTHKEMLTHLKNTVIFLFYVVYVNFKFFTMKVSKTLEISTFAVN